jgi:hypothetical protein
MRRRSTKHHPNIAEIVQSAQHLELLEVSSYQPAVQRRLWRFTRIHDLDRRAVDAATIPPRSRASAMPSPRVRR